MKEKRIELAIEAIAPAVYSPIPGSFKSSLYSDGILPLYSSKITIAAFFKFFARL